MSKDLKYIDDIVKKSLSDLTIASPVGSWEMLEKNIPKKGFFQFDLSSFNIYYLSTIAVASIAIILSLYFNKAEKINPIKTQLTTIDTNNEQEINQTNINNNKINLKEKEEQTSTNLKLKDINTTTNLSPAINNEPTKATNELPINNYQSTTTNNQPLIDNPNKQNDQTTEDLITALNTSNTIVQKNPVKNIVQENKTHKIIVQEKNENTTQPNITKNEEHITPNNNIEKNTTISNNSEIILNEKVEAETKELINNNNSTQTNNTNNSVNNEQKEESIIVIENQQQQAYPDTVGKNAQGENIIIETTHWSFDLFATGLQNNPITTSNTSTNESTVNLIKNSQSSGYTFSVGGNLNYSFKNWIVQLGASYTQLGEKNVFKNRILLTDSIISGYNQEPYQYYDVDTVWFYNLDSLIIGVIDSVAIYDSTLETGYNNIPVWTIDSNNVTKKHSIQNKYTYLELPLIFGYEIHKNKFSYSLKAGLITGIFLNAKGKTISFDDSKTIVSINEDMPFIKTNFTLLFGCGINYKLTEKYSLISEVIYRRNLNSIFDNTYPISQKYNTFGLKLGFRYTF